MTTGAQPNQPDPTDAEIERMAREKLGGYYAEDWFTWDSSSDAYKTGFADGYAARLSSVGRDAARDALIEAADDPANERLAVLIHARRCNWGEWSSPYSSAQDCWDDPIQDEHRDGFRREATIQRADVAAARARGLTP